MDQSQKSRIQKFLTARRSEQFAFLAAMIRQPSENPPGVCQGLATDLAERLTRLGFSVKKYPEPEAGIDINDNGLVNLVVRHEFGDGPVIALVAHGDTAVVGPDWTREPFGAEIDQGRMYGRGAVASKGTLAAYVYALLAMRDHVEGLHGAIELHISFDGETGGDLGCRWLVANKLVAPDMVIASGTTHNLITTAKGFLLLEVEIKGRSAPASLPEAGIDTLEAAAKVMSAIYDLRADYRKIRSRVDGIGSPSIVISQIRGGESSRTVGGRTLINIDRRLIPGEDPSKVENDLTTLIGTSVVQVPGVVCKVRRKGLSLPMIPHKNTDRLIDAFQRHAPDVMGAQLEIAGTPLDTDGRHYANAGIPTVLYGVGPKDSGEAGVGGPDEALLLDDLRCSTELLVYTLSDLLNPETS